MLIPLLPLLTPRNPAHTTVHSHHKSPRRALKEALNDDDERHDPDQLPISPMSVEEEEDQKLLVDLIHVMQGFMVELDLDLLPLDLPITLQTKNSPLGSSLTIAVGGGGVGSGSPSMTIEVGETDADADADPEAEAQVGPEDTEILGAVAATSRNPTDAEEKGAMMVTGMEILTLDPDADADAELLAAVEAVDAAETNSNIRSHGGSDPGLGSIFLVQERQSVQQVHCLTF